MSTHYIAQKFVAASSDSQISGQLTLALIQNINQDEIQPLLEKHHLTDIDAMKWYRFQDVLDLLRDIANGESSVQENLTAIGTKAAETIMLPPTINTIEDVINSTEIAQTLNYRNIPPEEGPKVKWIRPGFVLIIFNSPIPQEVLYGNMWGLIRRFKPNNIFFVIRVIDNPFPDDLPGMVFEIRWGKDISSLKEITSPLPRG